MEECQAKDWQSFTRKKKDHLAAMWKGGHRETGVKSGQKTCWEADAVVWVRDGKGLD